MVLPLLFLINYFVLNFLVRSCSWTNGDVLFDITVHSNLCQNVNIVRITHLKAQRILIQLDKNNLSHVLIAYYLNAAMAITYFLS